MLMAGFWNYGVHAGPSVQVELGGPSDSKRVRIGLEVKASKAYDYWKTGTYGSHPCGLHVGGPTMVVSGQVRILFGRSELTVEVGGQAGAMVPLAVFGPSWIQLTALQGQAGMGWRSTLGLYPYYGASIGLPASDVGIVRRQNDGDRNQSLLVSASGLPMFLGCPD